MQIYRGSQIQNTDVSLEESWIMDIQWMFHSHPCKGASTCLLETFLTITALFFNTTSITDGCSLQGSVCVCAGRHTHTHTHAHTSTSECKCVCVYMCVGACECVCPCMGVDVLCECVCVCVHQCVVLSIIQDHVYGCVIYVCMGTCEPGRREGLKSTIRQH